MNFKFSKIIPLLHLERFIQKITRISIDNTKTQDIFSPKGFYYFGIICKKQEKLTQKNEEKYLNCTLTDLNQSKVYLISYDIHLSFLKEQPLGSVILFSDFKVHKEQNSILINFNKNSQIKKIGTSLDFSICQFKDEKGIACDSWINKRKGKYCSEHLSFLLEMMRSQRADLNSQKMAVQRSDQESRKRGTDEIQILRKTDHSFERKRQIITKLQNSKHKTNGLRSVCISLDKSKNLNKKKTIEELELLKNKKTRKSHQLAMSIISNSQPCLGRGFNTNEKDEENFLILK
ncbi:protein mcm10 [Anaeramoeba ignava]|uniref:Protein mcm10 n=1 Tax=Anaeramoeba ignava TaxID=1746090 RepID=A0A9Q0LHQ4_ANAIG|nr:protein mcm10 [Anaeramoeba ignava]